MVRVLEFNWAEADLVVQPVQAVVVHAVQNGVVIRQQKTIERDRDDIVNIPHHSLGRLIRSLQMLQNSDFFNGDDMGSAELVEILTTQ